MLSRIVELKEPLAVFAAEEDITNWNIQKSILEKVIPALSPFQNVTDKLSSGSASAADGIPTVRWLNNMLSNNVDAKRISSFVESLQSNMDVKFGNLETIDEFAIATFIDPRYKENIFVKAGTMSNIVETLKLLISNANEQNDFIIQMPTPSKKPRVENKREVGSCNDFIASSSDDEDDSRNVSGDMDYIDKMKPPVDDREDQATNIISALPSTNFSKTSKSFDSLRFEGSNNNVDSTAMAATKKLISIPFEENNSGSIICPKNSSDRSIFFDNLLSQHVAVGHFLSRSQDSLTKVSDSNSISVLLSTTPVGHAKNENFRSTVKQRQSKNANSLSNANRTMSSAQLGAVRRVHSPLVGEPPSIQGSKTFSKISNGNETIRHRNTTNATQQKHQQADPRITRTKMTVTELQKQKLDLEAYVTELVKKAEHKQTELANMKIEIRRLKEEKCIEYEKLRQENQNLKRLLTPDESNILCCKMFVDVSTSPIPSRSLSMEKTTTDDSGSGPEKCGSIVDHDPAPDFGGCPTVDEIMLPHSSTSATFSGCCLPTSAGSTKQQNLEWDRQSTGSEISLACLQDRIVQMEETHYSTNEELQATLQELTDLQDTVNDLIQENRLLFDEKSLLYDSLCKQSSKLDNYRLQIENLKHLLLSSTEICFKRRFANTQDDDDQESAVEENQRLLEILKNTHEEYDDLLKKYDTLRSSYKIVDDEHINDRKSLFKLNEKLNLHEKCFETYNSEKKLSEKLLIKVQSNLERCQRDLKKARKECEKEKKRISEMQQLFAANNNAAEVQNLLDSLHQERDEFENKIASIEDLLENTFNDLNTLKENNVIHDNDLASNRQTTGSSEDAAKIIERENIHENEASKIELLELKAAFLELNRSFERQVGDKKELHDDIFTLQKALDDCENDLKRVRKEFLELNALREKETEDWKQFQADLQIAVVVANDFKVEAQDEIEKLTFENSQLNDQVSMLKCEMEKLRNKPNSCEEHNSPMKNHSFASSTPSSVCGNIASPELKAKLTGYLSNIETTSNASTPFMGKSKYLMPHSANKCVLSVRALVESLENASIHRRPRNCVAANVPLRSPGALGKNLTTTAEKDKSIIAPGSVNDSHSLSVPDERMSNATKLSARPVSLESIDTFRSNGSSPGGAKSLKNISSPTQHLIAASSERGVASNAPIRNSPQKNVELLGAIIDAQNQSTVDENISSSSSCSMANIRLGKGILKNQQMSAPARKLSYLDIENNDPLSKLMKDAPRGSRRNALLRWCQNRTANYKNVEVTNFSSSWNDGLAFCALLHSFSPDKILYDTLDSNDKRRNFTLAFKAGESLGIPAVLNVDELVCLERPNWQSVMTYVTSIYKLLDLGNC